MTRRLKKEIRKWIADYQQMTGNYGIGDDETLEGSAYNLLNSVLVEEKEIDRQQLNYRLLKEAK